MRKHTVGGLLALALLAATSATASSTTQPLVVRGAHFYRHELVRLSAVSGTTFAAAMVTSSRTGRIVARFDYTPPMCLRLVVQATGRRGDHAKLVVKPQTGSTGVPCGL